MASDVSPIVAAAHSPISTPALKLSVAKVASAASAGSNGVSSAITSMPVVAGLLDHRHQGAAVGRGDQDALGAAGDAGFDRGHLGFHVSVELAREGVELDAKLLGLGRGAFLHLHEEGVGVGLGDQAGVHVALHVGLGRGDASGKSKSSGAQKRGPEGQIGQGFLLPYILEGPEMQADGEGRMHARTLRHQGKSESQRPVNKYIIVI